MPSRSSRRSTSSNHTCISNYQGVKKAARLTTSLGDSGVAGYTGAMTLQTLGRSRLRFPILAVVALSIGLAGCGGGGKPKKDVAYVARDVDTLYITAKQKLDEGEAKQSAALFDEVERQHPYSPWARRAQLMGAFSYYMARDYAKSIQASQRFLSVHPGNKDAPYAYYLVALCYYEQISDVRRDQKDTRQALDALTEVIRRYPSTAYATDAKLKLDLVNDHLAGKEMEIGRYYLKRNQVVAAINRFRYVVENYQTTSHVPEALHRLTEAYLSLGVVDEAKAAAAVLGYNFPGSEWYLDSYALLTGQNMRPEEKKGSWLSRIF